MNTYGYICLTIITVAVLAVPSYLQRIAVALEERNVEQDPSTVNYVFPQQQGGSGV